MFSTGYRLVSEGAANQNGLTCRVSFISVGFLIEREGGCVRYVLRWQRDASTLRRPCGER
jgi:hypothetical protein